MVTITDRKIYLFALIFILVTFSFASGVLVSAEELVVCKGCSYSSIQTAIDKANPSDTVLIKEGLYKEHLKVDKDLLIKGQNKQEVTIRSNRTDHPMFIIGPSAIDVTITDLTVWDAGGLHCDGEDNACPYGLVARGKSNIKLSNVKIARNSHGGIYLSDSAEATVKDSHITNNLYGGIHLSGSAKINLEDNNIVNSNGSGVFLSDSSEAKIVNNMIRDHGDGISLRDKASAKIKFNTVRGTSTAIENKSTNPVVVAGNQIYDNSEELVGNIDQPEEREKWSMPSARKILLPNEDYSCLQHAIDALVSGGTIIVNGKLNASAIIEKDVTIKGGGKASTLAHHSKPVISLKEEADVTLKGLKIDGPDKGSGLVLRNNAKLGVKNSTIKASGNGLRLWNNSRAKIIESGLVNNSTGIALRDASRALIEGSLVEKNFIGIDLWENSKVAVERSEIRNSKKNGIRTNNSSTAYIKENNIIKTVKGFCWGVLQKFLTLVS